MDRSVGSKEYIKDSGMFFFRGPDAHHVPVHGFPCESPTRFRVQELHGHLNKVYCIGVENDTVVSGSEDMTVKALCIYCIAEERIRQHTVAVRGQPWVMDSCGTARPANVKGPARATQARFCVFCTLATSASAAGVAQHIVYFRKNLV